MEMYEVIAGSARWRGQNLRAGDTIEAEEPLDELFVGKYAKLDRRPKIKATKRLPSGDDPEVGPHDGPALLTRETEDSREVSIKDSGDEGIVDAGSVKRASASKPRRTTQAAKEPVQAKEPAQAKKPGRKAAASKQEAEDMEDMTGDFQLAKDNDLKVEYVPRKGYTIRDGKKSVNDTPIRDGKAVNAALEKYVKEKG